MFVLFQMKSHFDCLQYFLNAHQFIIITLFNKTGTVRYIHHDRESAAIIKNFPVEIIDLDTDELELIIKAIVEPVLHSHHVQGNLDISFYDTDTFEKKGRPSYWITFYTEKNCSIYCRIKQLYYGDVELKIQWDYNCDHRPDSLALIDDLEKCLVKILNKMLGPLRQTSNEVLRRRLDAAAGREFQAHPSNPIEKSIAEFAGLGMMRRR